jgi:hypothetical protein
VTAPGQTARLAAIKAILSEAHDEPFEADPASGKWWHMSASRMESMLYALSYQAAAAALSAAAARVEGLIASGAYRCPDCKAPEGPCIDEQAVLAAVRGDGCGVSGCIHAKGGPA